MFNCSTTALILAQQSLNIKTTKQQSSDEMEKIDNSTVIKTKRSIHNLLDVGLFSSKDSDKSLETEQNQYLKELRKSIDLSISESGQVLSPPSSSLSLLANNNNDNNIYIENNNNEKLVENNDINNSNDEDNQKSSFDEIDNIQRLQISGANLIYPYRFEAIYFRFGGGNFMESNSNSKTISSYGSEHRINSRSFIGELQLVAYNSLLYKSYFEASTKPNGLLHIAILLELQKSKKDDNMKQSSFIQNDNSNNNNDPLGMLLKQVEDIKFRDESVIIRNFNLSALLPDLEHFVSYDGSLTTPGCYESVNWLILNKPLYITQANVSISLLYCEYSRHLHIQWFFLFLLKILIFISTTIIITFDFCHKHKKNER